MMPYPERGVGKQDADSSPRPGHAPIWGPARGAERCCSGSFAVPELHVQLAAWLRKASTLAPQLESRLRACFLGTLQEGGPGACAGGAVGGVRCWLRARLHSPAGSTTSLWSPTRGVLWVLLVLSLSTAVMLRWDSRP